MVGSGSAGEELGVAEVVGPSVGAGFSSSEVVGSRTGGIGVHEPPCDQIRT